MCIDSGKISATTTSGDQQTAAAKYPLNENTPAAKHPLIYVVNISAMSYVVNISQFNY
jgi:hypothetical protein